MEFDYKKIGERIQYTRQERGFRQYQLAEMLDITDAHLSRIEHGVQRPSFDLFLRLCAALDASADYLLFGIHPQAGRLSSHEKIGIAQNAAHRDLIDNFTRILSDYSIDYER